MNTMLCARFANNSKREKLYLFNFIANRIIEKWGGKRFVLNEKLNCFKAFVSVTVTVVM